MIREAYHKIHAGGMLTKEELMGLSRQPLEALRKAADVLRRELCGNGFDLCTIVNGKSGSCSEDCKYCAQSAFHKAEIRTYPLIPADRLLQEALYNWKKGVLRFSIVTSGRALEEKEVEQLCTVYKAIGTACGIRLCASHGLLKKEQLIKLKEAGVFRYHNNLETSRRFFPQICTTHTYDEKIFTIKAAQEAGLTVCSGGIFGLGENMEDRIDLALQLRELGIRSVPINVLNPIPGTPLEGRDPLSEEEIIRSIALFRFALPQASIRLAGGRGLFSDKGKEFLQAGTNAAITGDMLTTSGISIREDLEMLQTLGFEVKYNE